MYICMYVRRHQYVCIYVCMYLTKHYYDEAVGEKNQEILLGVKWERRILRSKNAGNVT